MKITQNYAKQEECTARIVEWLHQVWLLIRDKRCDTLQPNPFYARNDLLTMDVVDKVIAAIEDIFVYEFKNYRAYHNREQGQPAGMTLVPPGFGKLTAGQKFALVQGIDRIAQDYVAAPGEVVVEYKQEEGYPYDFTI